MGRLLALSCDPFVGVSFAFTLLVRLRHDLLMDFLFNFKSFFCSAHKLKIDFIERSGVGRSDFFEKGSATKSGRKSFRAEVRSDADFHRHKFIFNFMLESARGERLSGRRKISRDFPVS